MVNVKAGRIFVALGYITEPTWKSCTYHWLRINGDLPKMDQPYRAQCVSVQLNAYPWQEWQESVMGVKQNKKQKAKKSGDAVHVVV